MRGADLILLRHLDTRTSTASACSRNGAEGDGLPCPVIAMSGHGTVETAVEATPRAPGLHREPLSMAELLLTLERALRSRQAPPRERRPHSATRGR